MWYLRPSWIFISAELENICHKYLSFPQHFISVPIHCYSQHTFWLFTASLKDSRLGFKIFWFFHSLPSPNCWKWGILAGARTPTFQCLNLLSPENSVLFSPLNCKIHLLESICIFGSCKKLLFFFLKSVYFIYKAETPF